MIATLLLVIVLGFGIWLIGERADRTMGARTMKEAGGGVVERPMRSPVSLTVPAPRLYRGRPATYWASRYRFRTGQLQQARRALHRRWAPTVDYAFRLASNVFGVSYWQLRSVAWCESRHNVFASNGRYQGLFQLSWAPYGFSPFDPVASALSTAATVSREGWRQWECKP